MDQVKSTKSNPLTVGEQMYELLVKLFPIHRSITGKGIRHTLSSLKDYISIKVHEVPSGTKVADWEVPKEWNIRDAFILDDEGKKLIDFKKNNLHVVAYSTPVDKWINLEDLQKHLHSLPEQPDAIPYITSYYKENWGFCITEKQRKSLKKGKYHVVIDSELKNGNLTYGEFIVKGYSEKEIFLSTWICHPSMANDQLSGTVLTTFLAKWIASKPRKYSYRIIFIPGTIGSITYLHGHLDEMKRNIIAGYSIACVGDEGPFSYIPSRYGNTLADKAVLNILKFKRPDFVKYTFLDRGGDERQYCSPGVDLPVVALTRSKFGTYDEYHTSLDNLDFVTPNGLEGTYNLIKECLELIESNEKYSIKCICEPQLGKRGLYPNLATRISRETVKDMMNFIAYADGKNDLIDISNLINVPVSELYIFIEKLLKCDLLYMPNYEH